MEIKNKNEILQNYFDIFYNSKEALQDEIKEAAQNYKNTSRFFADFLTQKAFEMQILNDFYNMLLKYKD